MLAPDDDLFGIGRQIEGGELAGGIGRDADAADPRRDKAIAAFDAAGIRIGVELGAQLIDAGDGHGAIGGDVLPAIGQRAGDIGRADGVPHERAGLEQVGAAAAAVRDAETGAAAGQRKARDRERRDAIVGADRGAGDAQVVVLEPSAALPSVVCEPP